MRANQIGPDAHNTSDWFATMQPHEGYKIMEHAVRNTIQSSFLPQKSSSSRSIETSQFMHF